MLPQNGEAVARSLIIWDRRNIRMIGGRRSSGRGGAALRSVTPSPLQQAGRRYIAVRRVRDQCVTEMIPTSRAVQVC